MTLMQHTKQMSHLQSNAYIRTNDDNDRTIREQGYLKTTTYLSRIEDYLFGLYEIFKKGKKR